MGYGGENKGGFYDSRKKVFGELQHTTCSCLIDNKRKEGFREVNIKEFNTIGYFIKYYFNWSMNYAELEDCIEDFLMREKEENIKVFIKEIERMYRLNDPELIRKVAYELGDRGMPTDKALYMIKLLYTKTQSLI